MSDEPATTAPKTGLVLDADVKVADAISLDRPDNGYVLIGLEIESLSFQLSQNEEAPSGEVVVALEHQKAVALSLLLETAIKKLNARLKKRVH